MNKLDSVATIPLARYEELIIAEKALAEYREENTVFTAHYNPYTQAPTIILHKSEHEALAAMCSKFNEATDKILKLDKELKSQKRFNSRLLGRNFWQRILNLEVSNVYPD
jgi:CRISPR/Cas system CMR-associated protein Cmr5 small subunit